MDDYRQRFNNPYFAARAGYVDDIIEPSESRPKIIASLSALRDKLQPCATAENMEISLYKFVFMNAFLNVIGECFPMDPNGMISAIQITIAGMGLVFLAILVLWLVHGPASQVGPRTEEDLSNEAQKAAAAAVAFALAERAGSEGSA